MIVACTVSYNSSEIIERTIDALLRQSYPIDRIVIADNCSTQENKDRLASYKEKSNAIDIIWLDCNGGGARGFYEAMKYTQETYHPDWYWLMDDDAFPEDDCLSKLLENAKGLDDIGFVAPVIWGIDNKKYQLYHARKSTTNKFNFDKICDSFDQLNSVERLDVDAFVGPLISKRAVESCGFPRPGYFLEGDDTDYTYRITRVLNGYLIKEAQINHKDLVISSGINPGMWWKQYYSFRNPLLFAYNNYLGLDRMKAILLHLRYAGKQIVKMFLDERYKGYRVFRLKILLRGIRDGIQKKDGIVVEPSAYKELLARFEANRTA